MGHLKDIFETNGSDKAKHGYHEIYEKHLEKIKDNVGLNILEVGIWKGSSHKSWLEYFPKSEIFGIDIFERVKENEVQVLKHPRMHHLKASSMDVNLHQRMSDKWPGIRFDVIIDDGMHTPDSNRRTFLNLSPFFAANFQYFIEDVWPIQRMTDIEKQHPWIKKKSREFTDEKYLSFLSVIHQEKYTSTHYDLRERTKTPDSYIIHVEENTL